MLQLFGHARSINVRKVLWLLDELALPFTHDPAPSPDALRALNPNALVPVLRDGDFVLCESNTICRYLATRAGRVDLLPAEPAARARVEQWMDWQATELNNAWRYAFMAKVRLSPAYTEPAAIAASLAEWNQHMRLLDAQLARGGPYLLGETLSLADIVLGLSTQRWYASPIERVELPAVAAYYAHLGTREGFRRHGCNGLP